MRKVGEHVKIETEQYNPEALGRTETENSN